MPGITGCKRILLISFLFSIAVCPLALGKSFQYEDSQDQHDVHNDRRFRRYSSASYCPVADHASYRLTISFVLCIDYSILQPHERTKIVNKIKLFANIQESRLSMYRLYVRDQSALYYKTRSPPGEICSEKTNIDNGLADPWGWRDLYAGQQTSADIQFTCAETNRVAALISKIKQEISQNKLHDHVGFHVIGWVLHRWRCPAMQTTPKPETTKQATDVTSRPTPESTPEPTPETTTQPTPEVTTKPAPETTTNPKPEPTTQPTPEPTTQPTPETTTQPTPETTTQPTPETTTQPTPETTTQPTPETTTQPTPETTTQPTPEPTTQPTPETTTQPTPETTTQPTPETTTQPTPEPTTQPTPEPTTQPTPETTTQPTPGTTTQPAPETTTKPKPEPTTQPTPETTKQPTPETTTRPTPQPSTKPKPEPTTQPTPETTTWTATVSTTQPTNPCTVTYTPSTYCPSVDTARYSLTISFLLCIDYYKLEQHEVDTIRNKISRFTNKGLADVMLYQLFIADQSTAYLEIKSHFGQSRSERQNLDNGLADPGGWRSQYNGNQTSADVIFSCAEAQKVSNLVNKIKYEVSLNKLHDYVGFHVIGWVLYRWKCASTNPTSQPSTTTVSSTQQTTASSTQNPITIPSTRKPTSVNLDSTTTSSVTTMSSTTESKISSSVKTTTTKSPTTPEARTTQSTRSSVPTTKPKTTTDSTKTKQTTKPLTTRKTSTASERTSKSSENPATTKKLSTTQANTKSPNTDPGTTQSPTSQQPASSKPSTTPAVTKKSSTVKKSTDGSAMSSTSEPVTMTSSTAKKTTEMTKPGPTSKITSMQPSPTTRTSTDGPFTSISSATTSTGIPSKCASPNLINPIRNVSITTGRMFSYRIPQRTFHDAEDGDTRSLSLTVTPVGDNFPAVCWYSFNAYSQVLDGLPYTKLLGRSKRAEFLFNLKATDSCGLTAMDNMSLILERPDRQCFQMTFDFMTRKDSSCEWVAVKAFVAKVATFYGYNIQNDISVVDYRRQGNQPNKFTVTISFAQRIIKCDQCNSTAISQLTYKVLHDSNYTVHYGFNAYLSPMFTVSNVLVVSVDACSAYILPLMQGKNKGLSIWAWLIPVIIFTAALALTCLLALCRYCGCACCLCLFPADEDEEYFARKEVRPLDHRASEEYIGSDVEYNFPSFRKNRAGPVPDNSSIESADDVVASGNRVGGPPPYKTDKGGTKSVTTIIYASPPIGKESTELSVFPARPTDDSLTGDGVNVTYHNMAETSFHGDEEHRSPGNFRDLQRQKNNGNGMFKNGISNKGFSGSVAMDINNLQRQTEDDQLNLNGIGNLNIAPPGWDDGTAEEGDQRSSLRKDSIGSLSDEVLDSLPTSPLTPLTDYRFPDIRYVDDQKMEKQRSNKKRKKGSKEKKRGKTVSASGTTQGNEEPSQEAVVGKSGKSHIGISNGGFSSEILHDNNAPVSLTADISRKGILKNKKQSSTHVGLRSSQTSSKANISGGYEVCEPVFADKGVKSSVSMENHDNDHVSSTAEASLLIKEGINALESNSHLAGLFDMSATDLSNGNVKTGADPSRSASGNLQLSRNCRSRHEGDSSDRFSSQANFSSSAFMPVQNPSDRQSNADTTADTFTSSLPRTHLSQCQHKANDNCQSCHHQDMNGFMGESSSSATEKNPFLNDEAADICISCKSKNQQTQAECYFDSTKRSCVAACVSCSQMIQMQPNTAHPSDSSIQLKNQTKAEDENTGIDQSICNPNCPNSIQEAQLASQNDADINSGCMTQFSIARNQGMNFTNQRSSDLEGKAICSGCIMRINSKLDVGSAENKLGSSICNFKTGSAVGLNCNHAPLPTRADAVSSKEAAIKSEIEMKSREFREVCTICKATMAENQMAQKSEVANRSRERHEGDMTNTSLPILGEGIETRCAHLSENRGNKDSTASEMNISSRSYSGSSNGHVTTGHCYPVTPGSDSFQVNCSSLHLQPDAPTDLAAENRYSSSLNVNQAARDFKSNLTVGISGSSKNANAGNVSSYHTDIDDVRNPHHVTTGVYYPGQKSRQRGANNGELFASADLRSQEIGKSSFVSKFEYDATYRDSQNFSKELPLESRRDSLPTAIECGIVCDSSREAELRRQASFNKRRADLEQFEFASCESAYDTIRRASLHNTDWQTGYEGGIAGVDNEAGAIRDALRRDSAYETAEEGGFSTGRNYGVDRAGIRKTHWERGTKCGVGDGRGKADDVWLATLQNSDWGKGRRRYLSDSCIDDDDDDDDECLLPNDHEGYESCGENLRLPAVPTDSCYRERTYSLPDHLDEYDDLPLVAPQERDSRRRKLIESVKFITSAKQNSLRRNSSRRGSGASFKRRHPGEAGLIMRRGWFDVRRSIRVKVPVSMKAKITKPPIITGPHHMDTLRVKTIDLPQGVGMPDEVTLTSTPQTRVTVGGRSLKTTTESSAPEHQVRFPVTFDDEFKVPHGTYEVTIPLRQ